MKNNIYVENYQSVLNLRETEEAIKFLKDYFEIQLAKSLNLIRVSAPIFVDPETGLNDNLSGVEIPVSFRCSDNKKLEVVHSLAKWKRHALKKYGFNVDEGLYTDMNAIRAFEDLDNVHSLYVDQWDWERIICEEERNLSFLKKIVRKIYATLKKTAKALNDRFAKLNIQLPKNIKFVTTYELESLYPTADRKERENLICKKYGAVFLMNIGDVLKDGKPHDGRSPDYDDWNLNGDLLMYNEVLDCAFELSSMGIRVNKDRLLYQLDKRGIDKFTQYHLDVINNQLPLTIGGGIGQSRLCMFLLKKCHIGEVQCSYWNQDDIEHFESINVHLL